MAPDGQAINLEAALLGRLEAPGAKEDFRTCDRDTGGVTHRSGEGPMLLSCHEVG